MTEGELRAWLLTLDVQADFDRLARSVLRDLLDAAFLLPLCQMGFHLIRLRCLFTDLQEMSQLAGRRLEFSLIGKDVPQQVASKKRRRRPSSLQP